MVFFLKFFTRDTTKIPAKIPAKQANPAGTGTKLPNPGQYPGFRRDPGRALVILYIYIYQSIYQVLYFDVINHVQSL